MRKWISIPAVVVAVVIAYASWMRWSNGDRRASSAESLRQIGLALENYYSVYKEYPPSKLNGHSWRIRCVPFITSSPLFEHYDFDAPWDSVGNMTIHSRPLRNGKGPDPDALDVCGVPYAFQGSEELDYQTMFLMVVGDNAYGDPYRGRNKDELTDSLECTIAVAETARRDVHWLYPLDFDVDELSLRINDGPSSISSRDPRGPLVLFADGGVYRLNPAIDVDTMKALITINGNEDVSRARLMERGVLTEP